MFPDNFSQNSKVTVDTLLASLSDFNRQMETRRLTQAELRSHIENAISQVCQLETEKNNATSPIKQHMLRHISKHLNEMATNLQQPQHNMANKLASNVQIQAIPQSVVSAVQGAPTNEKFEGNPSKTEFSHLAAMKEIIDRLRLMFILPLKQPQIYQSTSRYKSLLLFGPPGCGKTQLVGALSRELNATLYCLTPSTTLSKYVGESEKVVSNLFNQLRESSQRSVLFVDEIDAFCRARSDAEAEHSRRLKTEFLNQLTAAKEDAHVTVAAATNVPWEIDNAIARRFELQMHVGLPTRAARGEILQFLLNARDASPDDSSSHMHSVLWGSVLNSTHKYSVSDLENVVRYAAHIPIEELVANQFWCEKDRLFVPCASDAKGSVACSVWDIPEGRVAAPRALELLDLVIAAQRVSRTVDDQQLAKFDEYLQSK